MVKKVLFLVFAVFAGITISYANQKTAETITATGSGDAPITEGDYIDARQNAKNAATGEALWKAIEELSGPEAAAAHAEKIRAELLPRAMDFAHKYKFSEEVISPNSATYHVTMEVVFFSELIQNELEKLGTAITRKKSVVLVIDERPMEVVMEGSFLYTSSLTEERLKAAAAEAGYHTAGRMEVRGLKNDALAVKAVEGDKEAIKWLASQLKPDYVITGKVRVTAEGAELRGKTIVTAYEPKGAEQVWSSESTGAVPGGNGTNRYKAVRQCAEKLALPLTEFLKPSGEKAKEEIPPAQ